MSLAAWTWARACKAPTSQSEQQSKWVALNSHFANLASHHHHRQCADIISRTHAIAQNITEKVGHFVCRLCVLATHSPKRPVL